MNKTDLPKHNSMTLFTQVLTKNTWQLLCYVKTVAYQVWQNFINPSNSTINAFFCSFDNNKVTLWWSAWKAHTDTTKVFTDLCQNLTTSSNEMPMMPRLDPYLSFCFVFLQHDRSQLSSYNTRGTKLQLIHLQLNSICSLLLKLFALNLNHKY